jgi:hypothetical protein
MPIVVDAAEFAAISTVVRAIVATMAYQIERSKVGGGQAWINSVSAACQDAILQGDISIGARDAEDFRRKTMEHVNRILNALERSRRRKGDTADPIIVPTLSRYRRGANHFRQDSRRCASSLLCLLAAESGGARPFDHLQRADCSWF